MRKNQKDNSHTYQFLGPHQSPAILINPFSCRHNTHKIPPSAKGPLIPLKWVVWAEKGGGRICVGAAWEAATLDTSATSGVWTLKILCSSQSFHIVTQNSLPHHNVKTPQCPQRVLRAILHTCWTHPTQNTLHHSDALPCGTPNVVKV